MLKETKIKSIRHPEVLTEGSIDSSHSFRMTQCETGRSMVEMLGVLAVIGILSVAGIAGYKNAMNRHRANELLNEASKRATIVAMQAAQGKTTFSVAEFGNAKVGDATLDVIPVGTSQFAITISQMDKDVCQNILNTIGENTQVRAMALSASPGTKITACGADGTAYALVYNNDLSKNDPVLKDGQGNCIKKGYTGENCDEQITCGAAQQWSEEEGCVCPEGLYGPNCDSDCNGAKDKNGVCYECPVAADGSIESSAGFTQAECARCGGFAVFNDSTYGRGWVASGDCPSYSYITSCHSTMSIGQINTHCIKGLKTLWFDLTYPNYAAAPEGDYETYANIRAAGYDICSNPTEILCEGVDYPGYTLEQIGQVVSCDLATGFTCNNNDQSGIFKMCYDYLIRITCP